jgi:uncharacterized membrane protein
MKAIKIIDSINKYPRRFWMKVSLSHCLFASAIYGVAISSIDAAYGMAIFGTIAAIYMAYMWLIYPLCVQSLRRTCPVLIFDDLNKI